MRNLMGAVFFMVIWAAVMTMVGCEGGDFERHHPIAAEVIDDVEAIVEPMVDEALDLPPGTTKVVVDALEDVVEEVCVDCW